MARENFNAAYVGSQDFWGFDSDTFNEETNFYADVWVVGSDGASKEVIDDQNLNPCALYYEVGKTDDHLFTPTEIIYDSDAGVLLIVGEQGRIGEPDVTAEQRRFYSIGQKARRYKHMTDGQSSRDAGRFSVDKIVVSNEDDKKEIVEYLEKQEEALMAAEEFYSEGANQDYMEEWNADNLDRINPMFVEGAEDIHGAEEFSGEIAEDTGGSPIEVEISDAEDINVDAAFIHYGSENDPNSWAVEVHTADGETFLAEMATGCIIHHNSSFAAEDATPLCSNEIGEILSIAAETVGSPSYVFESADYDATAYSPSDYDPTTTNPATEPHEAEDVVEFVQEVSPWNLNGWAASALVVATAMLVGWTFK